jgi:hypothetical protein
MAHEAEDERFVFLAGQVQAIIGSLLALAKLHPSPEALKIELSAMEQAAIARAESTLIGDNYLEGIRDVVARLQAVLAKRLGSP